MLRSASRSYLPQCSSHESKLTVADHSSKQRTTTGLSLIAVEDLNINGMVHNRCLAKSIYDAAWSQFRQVLSYKAEEAGRTLVAVNPAFTSQDCSECGHRLRKALSQHRHECPYCGLHINRDENAARNILRLGTQSAAACDAKKRSPLGDRMFTTTATGTEPAPPLGSAGPGRTRGCALASLPDRCTPP